MKGSAFVPGHITGFFEIFDSEDPGKAGSKGAGVVLDKGVYTTVKLREGDGVSVKLNGEICDCPVTKAAVEDVLGPSHEKFSVEVFHESELPMKYGFGISGAGAFGSTLAINRALGLDLTLNQCGAIAHRAEVINRTGLGDVIAQSVGGLVIRTEPGAPGTGKTDQIFSDKRIVTFIVGEEMDTKSILLDRTKKARINTFGRECLIKLLKKPTPENFLELSRNFAINTKLIDKKVHTAVSALEKEGISSSMSMLGNTVFTLTSDPKRVAEHLDFPYTIADIDYIGARIMV